MEFFVINKTPKDDYDPQLCRTNFEYDESVVKSGSPKCPECGSFIGMLQALPPYRIHLETWGNGYGDFAFWMTDFLVTKDVCDAYRGSSLTGLSEFLATEILTHANHGGIVDDPPAYFRTIPRIGSARIDLSASGVEWKEDERPTCDCCLGNGGALKGWRRVILDECSWNGDDIFYAYGLPGVLVASSRFVDWAETNQFRNFIWEKSEMSSRVFVG
jgi:hypothetical protein